MFMVNYSQGDVEIKETEQPITNKVMLLESLRFHKDKTLWAKAVGTYFLQWFKKIQHLVYVLLLCLLLNVFYLLVASIVSDEINLRTEV